jgi:hypothetical protein
MVDFNIFKFEIEIRKVFDKGQIDKMYRQMYNVAVEVASRDAKIALASELAEHFDSLYGGKGEEQITESALSIPVRVSAYKRARIDFHLGNMMHALELYVKSKIRDKTSDD